MIIDKELSSRIRSGDIMAIMDGFLHKGQLYNVQSIISCVNHSIFNSEIEEQLNRLSLISGDILGYEVSDYATAALVKLGGYKYTGDRLEILKLISANKWFE